MRSFEVEYKGKWVSVNTLRNMQYWKVNNLKNEWRPKLQSMLKDVGASNMKLDKFKIEVRYNSRMDCDNVSLKFFCDSLKDLEIIEDDNKKHFLGYSVNYDETLGNSTYVIKVIEWQQ